MVTNQHSTNMEDFDEEEEKVKVDCICLGPTGSGKTLLMKRLQSDSSLDYTSSSVPTVGTTLKKIKLPNHKTIVIRELGGEMAPLWRNFFVKEVKKIMFVVDCSNLCQISAGGVLLYSILSEPKLQKTKVLLVLTKMDASYRQMRNEALLILQMNRLKREVTQPITIVQASSFNSEGIDEIFQWLQSS